MKSVYVEIFSADFFLVFFKVAWKNYNSFENAVIEKE